MAERDSARARGQRAGQRATGGKDAQRAGGGRATAGRGLEARIAALEAERDGLKSKLKAAEARIGELEACQADVANRIAWIVDSIHNILEGQD